MQLLGIKKSKTFKKITCTILYSRLRSRFPSKSPVIYDDRDTIGTGVRTVKMDWPLGIAKPKVGVIQDPGQTPRWTKYSRFLETNDIPFGFYDLNSLRWLQKAGDFDVIVGVESSNPYHLEEIRRKYYLLEHHLNKRCYPSYKDLLLYEDKILETYLSQIYHFPFIKTHVYNSRDEALQAADLFNYPLISKVVPASGSIGVELIGSKRQCISLIKKSFSKSGRKTHLPYAIQKNYVYFQDYVPNDGYDLRVIVIGNLVFGYYRKVLEGDFRASGMGVFEKRGLPLEAMRIARAVNTHLKCPMLVVDLLRGNDGQFYIIEISPICRVDTPEQLHVDGKPGVYVFSDDLTFQFKEGRYWVHELALKEYFRNEFIPHNLQREGNTACGLVL
jgi:glutathione synthase/RimK-type ligase-like ATP-grasp enzyme